MKQIVQIMMIVSGLTLAGCASLSQRFHTCDPTDWACCVSPIRQPRYVYPGTQVDLRGLAIPFWSSGDALYDGMTCIFYPIPLIDLPLSFVADTVFLPYDIYMVTRGGKARYREDIRKAPEPMVPGVSETRDDEAGSGSPQP